MNRSLLFAAVVLLLGAGAARADMIVPPPPPPKPPSRPAPEPDPVPVLAGVTASVGLVLAGVWLVRPRRRIPAPS